MRVDLYSFVHKAQRLYLFKLSSEISVTDFSNNAEADRITHQLREVIEHLRDHAKNEEVYIHPLYAKLGNMIGGIEQDHHDFEGDLNALEEVIEQKRWDELYVQYAHFLGKYLLHLAVEENMQKEVLWKHYDDATLLAVFNRFKMERSAQASKQDLELMLPALNMMELTRMFAGMKTSAPPPAFAVACELASRILPAEKWQKLKAVL